MRHARDLFLVVRTTIVTYCDIIPAGQSLGLKEDFQLLGDEPDPNKPCLTSIDACATHCIKFQVHKSPCNEFQT